MTLGDRYWKKPVSNRVEVLDIGCGMNPKKDATMLLDVDPEIDKHYGKSFVQHDLNVLPLPFQSCRFDKVYLSHVLEHLLVDDVSFLKEIMRVLKYNGTVHISVPNSMFIYHRILYFLGVEPCDFVLTHTKHYQFKHLKCVLRNAGFKIFELHNMWLFNPFRNWTNPHINIIAQKIG